MQFTPYRIAIILSSVSLVFGILREFLIVALFGFTAHNDTLQLYLSIFYTIGLSIDAVRLACLNLYTRLSLLQLLVSASIVALPFSIIIGILLSFATRGWNTSLVSVAIFGSYLNLLAALLITYKQRANVFLLAQIINVLPNFILIPGILYCYWLHPVNLIASIVLMTSLIPVVQCICLLLLPSSPQIIENKINLFASLSLFLRHLAAMTGEQLFQVIARAAFFNYGAGFLSIYAISVRIYAAARFILIDSFIGSKLSTWQDSSSKVMQVSFFGSLLLIFTLLFSLRMGTNLTYASIKIVLILLIGFYFSTLTRILYFKINRNETNTGLINRFAIYELMFAILTLILTQQANYPILLILWVGYIAKPFAQLALLRLRY